MNETLIFFKTIPFAITIHFSKFSFGQSTNHFYVLYGLKSFGFVSIQSVALVQTYVSPKIGHEY